MKPEKASQLLLGATRSKAKMLEYGIPENYHINLSQDPAKLFSLTIGILGDFVAKANQDLEDLAYFVEANKELLFSSYFFDAYLESKLDEEVSPYLLLIGSAAYYLCDQLGASKVLSTKLGEACPDLDCSGLDELLFWLLRGDISTCLEDKGNFGRYLELISREVQRFFSSGKGIGAVVLRRLRDKCYECATPRELLIANIIGAVIRKKYRNSCWYLLPKYSDLDVNKWRTAIEKHSFPRELWPSQQLLGEAGIFRGVSAVIQMPTSAGKTRATELIIRSAFLAERTSLAIIVAPFRALCHEIKNSLHSAFLGEPIYVDELSDVMQADFEVQEFFGGKQIIVVTPEKLLYALRREPLLAEKAGLVIFDEGHQFDSGTRGISYELLLTSLKLLLPSDAQKILISAVISNAKALGNWLNGQDSEVVTGENLTPTLRSIGFASWLHNLGRIEFVKWQNPDEEEYFVPRVIEEIKLPSRRRETKDRFFPARNDGKSIALYLALKLVRNGSAAIFVGRKDTAIGVCKKAIQIFERGISLEAPSNLSDIDEMRRLQYQFEKNLGTEAIATKSAILGIFSHHGNTPHGIRLSVEHAMRKELIRFVVCTSTLAQGVNLPIRYLVVTSIYQGDEMIKVRDFHNLIGRAGRAGMHTEGSILFADPKIYDTRKAEEEKWRWRQVKSLLKAKNSEPCISSLQSLFEPIRSDNKKDALEMKEMDLVEVYVNEPERIPEIIKRIASEIPGFSEENMMRQVRRKIDLISSIESFLMSNWDTKQGPLSETEVLDLAQGTLAYFIEESQEKRDLIKELFKLLAQNISRNITEVNQRKAYGRTLYGVTSTKHIQAWLDENVNKISASSNWHEILEWIWPLLFEYIENNTFKKCDKPEILQEIARGWLEGRSFHILFDTLRQQNAKLKWGKTRRDFAVEHVIELCENGLAYDGALLIGAIAEFASLMNVEYKQGMVELLNDFQKMLKYGLPNHASIALYELGLSDRMLAIEVSISLGLRDEKRKTVKKLIKQYREQVDQTVKKYPSYFHERLLDITRSN